jgi:ABC-type transport system involved in cytochrome c biogenesis ATPase subunit
MQFIRERHPPGDFSEHRNTCVLSDDNWDDFTFKTSFVATLFDHEGERYDLGPLKIMSKGMKSGRVEVLNRFESLGSDYCSLGADREYYVKLSGIHGALKLEFLRGIRDCVADPNIWQLFGDEEAMAQSLLRSVSVRDVEFNFPRLLAGHADLTAYSFSYHFRTQKDGPLVSCSFQVSPGTLPPSNIHVVIGRNGVGKTRLLAGMADALTESKASSIGLAGRFEFDDKVSDSDTDFLNLVVVAYSIFDRLNPIGEGTSRTKGSVPYQYVGIKKFSKGTIGEITLKSSDDMDAEFISCLKSMLFDGTRMERWTKAIEILESDPGIRELNLSRVLLTDDQVTNEISDQFATLSSGHKIVLLTITRIVELVSDRSLVLIDEPETHLHPPLLGSFIRALSDLLIARNGVAILATHSPVVLQEVPSNCVSILRRSGDFVRVTRPEVETFAENVSALTRKVFGLEVEDSGFFKLLKDSADGRDYEDVIEHFEDRVGAEGRALTRAFTSKDGAE